MEAWTGFWQWIYAHYIFHTVVIAAIAYIIFSGALRRFLRWIRRLKVGPGGIELETAPQDIDPSTPCPYKKSRDTTFEALRGVDDKVDKLTAEMRELMAIVKNMSIDQQKQLFYDTDQPTVDRLAGGLRYVHQGGNGSTKPKVIAFAGEHEDVYRGFVKAAPELRLIVDGNPL